MSACFWEENPSFQEQWRGCLAGVCFFSWGRRKKDTPLPPKPEFFLGDKSTDAQYGIRGQTENALCSPGSPILLRML